MAMDIEGLRQRLTDYLSTVKLGVAGRIVYYDIETDTFILAIHSTSPEETRRAGDIALDAIRDTIIPELQAVGIGFACKQI